MSPVLRFVVISKVVISKAIINVLSYCLIDTFENERSIDGILEVRKRLLPYESDLDMTELRGRPDLDQCYITFCVGNLRFCVLKCLFQPSLMFVGKSMSWSHKTFLDVNLLSLFESYIFSQEC